MEPESLPDPWYCSSCVATEAFDNDMNFAAAGNGDSSNQKNSALVDDDKTSGVATTAAIDEFCNNWGKILDSPPINSAASSLECNDRGKSALIGKSLIFFWVKNGGCPIYSLMGMHTDCKPCAIRSGVEPKVNMSIDILDSDSYYWSKGVIIHVKCITPKGSISKPPDPTKKYCLVTVRYEGWGSLLCEELPYPNERLAPVATYTKPIKCFAVLSGLKTKDMGFAKNTESSNTNVRNWTNAWPCRIYMRAPHQNNVHASNLLRNQNTIFVQPYMTYLLPVYLARFMVHGGQWLAADHCRQWINLRVKDTSTELTCVLHEISPRGQKKGTDSYFVTNIFCQALRAAQSDPLPIDSPTSLFPKKNGGYHDIETSEEQQRANIHLPKSNAKIKTASFIESVPETVPKSVKKRDKRDSQMNVKRKRLSPPHPAASSKAAIKQTSVTRRRPISPRPTSLKAASLATAPLPACVKPALSSLPSWSAHPPFLPPPIPITDMAFPDHGVRYLPNSCRWASLLRVSGNDLFVGSCESQSEAANCAELALQQSRSEKVRGVDESINVGGSEVVCSRPSRMTRSLHFLDSSSSPNNAGKLADLFNTSAESIVSAFEETQSKKDQKQSSSENTRFRIQDWMIQHSTHNMQQLINYDFAFVVDAKSDEKVHTKRRKQTNPRRLSQVSSAEEEHYFTNREHAEGTP